MRRDLPDISGPLPFSVYGQTGWHDGRTSSAAAYHLVFTAVANPASGRGRGVVRAGVVNGFLIDRHYTSYFLPLYYVCM